MVTVHVTKNIPIETGKNNRDVEHLFNRSPEYANKMTLQTTKLRAKVTSKPPKTNTNRQPTVAAVYINETNRDPIIISKWKPASKHDVWTDYKWEYIAKHSVELKKAALCRVICTRIPQLPVMSVNHGIHMTRRRHIVNTVYSASEQSSYRKVKM